MSDGFFWLNDERNKRHYSCLEVGRSLDRCAECLWRQENPLQSLRALVRKVCLNERASN